MADKDKEKDAAAEAPEEGAEAAEPKKKSPIILIAVLAIVGLALAAGISVFVTTKIMADAAAGHEDEDEDGKHEPGIFLQLGDPKDGILVNVGGPRGGKFLKTTIVLEMNPNKKSVINEETKAFNPDAEIKIMDITIQFLRSTKIEDFDAEKQAELKKQLKDTINAEFGGSSAVFDVYIKNFLLQ
jgi:flagellar FliL protein